MYRATLASLVASAFACSWAHAYCQPEASPCFRWERYTYNGSSFCRRWYGFATDDNYLIGLTSGIDPATYLVTVHAARDRWVEATTPALPDFSYHVDSPPDTSVVSYWLWVDDAKWTSQGENPNAAALTYRRVNGLGTVVHARTWLHVRPFNWRWSRDCNTEDCVGDVMTKPGLDFPTIVAHETGHWWVLKDISAAGCESVLMWGGIATNQVKRNPQPADALGIVYLYDQPTEISTTLYRSEVVANRVRLVWSIASTAPNQVAVERRDAATEWVRRRDIVADGEGYATFIDTEVIPGTRYAYRLRGPDGAPLTDEAWVDVPAWSLRIEAESPTSAADLRVRFTLPESAPAFLEMLDVAGRRLRRLDVGGYDRGPHTVQLTDGEVLHPGIYWLRLIQAARVAKMRAVIIR